MYDWDSLVTADLKLTAKWDESSDENEKPDEKPNDNPNGDEKPSEKPNDNPNGNEKPSEKPNDNPDKPGVSDTPGVPDDTNSGSVTTIVFGENEEKVFGKDTVIYGYAYFTESLSKFAGKEVIISLEVDMAVENTGDPANLMWQVNMGSSYPLVVEHEFPTGKTDWIHLSGSYGNNKDKDEEPLSLPSNAVLYLSTYQTTPENLTIHVKNLKYTITPFTIDPNTVENKWLDVEPLKKVYVESGIFENFGFAVSEDGMSDAEVLKGVTHHGTSVTAENSFKPDGLLYNVKSNPTTEFTSSKGKTIKVPDTLNFYSVDNYLKKAKDLGIRMRGHVLVWHSQTPEIFFKENFDSSKSFVSVEEMEARQEWYIKTVLEHVTKWEEENYDGKRLVYCWDVVNEAANDSASGDDYLRTGSNWYSIYKSSKFIVDAFRYANKYAPKDLLLAYNDYNEYDENKHAAILRIIDDIQAAKDDAELPTRIDVVGMQAHMQTAYPSAEALETTIKNFIAKGVDIHVTELDITGKWLNGNNCEPADPEEQKEAYKRVFGLYRKYAKSASNPNGVTGVTVWGIDDNTSWRSGGKPLLFRRYGGVYVAKPAYFGAIEAAKQ